jgi:pilus assembly protein CpaE
MARKWVRGAPDRDSERGQASVEFLAVLPAALLVALAGWQLALAGQAIWLSGNAARVGARAHAVGRDPADAARSALPSYLRHGLKVREGAGRVSVRVPVPLLLHGWRTPLRVGASASLEPG